MYCTTGRQVSKDLGNTDALGSEEQKLMLHAESGFPGVRGVKAGPSYCTTEYTVHLKP